MNSKHILIILAFIFLSGLLIFGGLEKDTTKGSLTESVELDRIDSNGPPTVTDDLPIESVEVPNDIIDETIEELDYQVTKYYRQSLDKQDFNYIQVLDNKIPLEIKQINHNYSKGSINNPLYLVIHETNNYSAGADANAHYRYWNSNPTAQASTHFVVDQHQIYQMLELNQVAWHVGDNKGHSSITNFNSIGIEITVNSDGDYLLARQNTIELTINLMNELKMDISKLKRHYDASGKWCPKIMLDDPKLWIDFVNQVSIGLNQ